MENKKKILGLMSGTSMDGLDLCVAELVIDSDYNLKFEIIGSDVIEYKQEVKKKMNYICSNNDSIKKKNFDIALVYLNLVKNHYLVKGNSFDGISIHGQTVHHIDKVLSIQLFDPKPLFDHFNVPIYFNFRAADLKLNGNGAPLVPYLDFMLYKNNFYDILTVNIGGISNLTFIPRFTVDRKNVLGFDVGPGMYLIDKFMIEVFKNKIDLNGNFSKGGKVNDDILLILKNCTFLNKKPPKSIHTDYYDFFYSKIMSKKYYEVRDIDKLRTLVFFTAYCICKNIENFINFTGKISLVYLNGGGSNHPVLISDIYKILTENKKVKFFFKKDNRLNSDIKESFLMCVLGFSRLKNLYSNMPAVTGSTNSVCLGEVYDERL